MRRFNKTICLFKYLQRKLNSFFINYTRVTTVIRRYNNNYNEQAVQV